MNQYKYTNRPYVSHSPGPAVSVAKPYRFRRSVALLAVVVLVVILGLFTFTSFERVHGSKLSGTESKAAATPSTVNSAALASEINAEIAAHPEAQISVAVTDLTTGSTYNYGVNAGYLGASTAKLITATLYMHEVEQGTHSLQTTVNGHTARYELQQLIEVSDNDAWTAFNTLLGDDNLEAWARQMGLTSYDVDTNILTTADMATLLTKLYRHELLNVSDTQLLLGHMAKANATGYIVDNVPSGVKVYHKAGYLSDRIHDAAIIDDGKHPYALVIFTKTEGDYDETSEDDIFKTITDSTVKYVLHRD